MDSLHIRIPMFSELAMKSWVYTRVTLLLSMTLILLPECGSPFLLSSECPAPFPCTCSRSSGNYIYNIHCDSKGLTDVPHFDLYNTSAERLYIYLSSNRIQTVPNYAFKNLSSIKATDIILYLDRNAKISAGIYAFAGINITSLQLNDNNLTSVPSAVGKMSKLRELDLQGNPLRFLDASLMSVLGHSLTTLRVDIGQFSEWPAGLHYLSKLQSLTVNYIPFYHLDINVFHGFENTLTFLMMKHVKFEKIPHAICRLSHLATLSVIYDTNLKENMSSIFEPCGYTLPALTNLEIVSGNLHEFPDVFTMFPSLQDLDVAGNRLEYIEISKIPSGSSLTSLYLQDNNFERIPSAVKKFKNLNILELHYNRIKTVESDDLDGLLSLGSLSLGNNPIVYISPYAFSHNPQISYLNLQSTDLDHIPLAVTHLPNLRYLYISGRPIDCTCDMSYLKHWSANVSAMSDFPGTCAASTETIKSFILTTLQSCT